MFTGIFKHYIIIHVLFLKLTKQGIIKKFKTEMKHKTQRKQRKTYVNKSKVQRTEHAKPVVKYIKIDYQPLRLPLVEGTDLIGDRRARVNAQVTG